MEQVLVNQRPVGADSFAQAVIILITAVFQLPSQVVLAGAYAQHSERFVKGQPTPPQLPGAVWINPPQAKAEDMPSS